MVEKSPSVDKLTEIYLKIKTRRDELSRVFKTEDDELKAQQDKIKSALLNHCKEANVESVRTEHGTFIRTVKTRYWATDWSEMHKFVLDRRLPEFFEKRLNQGAVKNYIEENPDDIPDGLNIDREYIITVRKPKQ